MGAATAILTLQNGWGNADRIAAVAGKTRVMVGLTYHSGTLLTPGRVHHSNSGKAFAGELNSPTSPRLEAAVAALNKAGVETTLSPRILDEVWKKLALNVCSLPTAAILRFAADRLVAHEGSLALMKGLLAEHVAVAHAQGIAIDEAERWEAITALLKRAVGARASMLQRRRRQAPDGDQRRQRRDRRSRRTFRYPDAAQRQHGLAGQEHAGSLSRRPRQIVTPQASGTVTSGDEAIYISRRRIGSS